MQAVWEAAEDDSFTRPPSFSAHDLTVTFLGKGEEAAVNH